MTILFAVSIGLLMLFSGGALDFVRLNAVNADLTESLDAAGLAMAQYDDVGGPDIDGLSGSAREAKLIEFGTAVFYENFSHESVVDNLNLQFDITPQRILPRASGSVRTLLLGAGRVLGSSSATGIEALEVNSSVEVTRRGAGRIELSLVLDVTGSMNSQSGGKRRIESLQDAVDNLLGVMFGESNESDFVKIGVVPFNAYVNPGGAGAWSASWSDADAEAYYHGARFLHVDGDGDIDNDGDIDIDPKGSASGDEFNDGILRMIDVDRKVNHFDLFNSSTELSWMGCVEARPYPLDELDTPPGSSTPTSEIQDAYAPLSSAEEPNSRMRTAFDRAPDPVLALNELTHVRNSRWVPMFIPDEPDCDGDGTDVCRGDWDWDTVSYDLAGQTRSIRTRGWMFDHPDGDDNDDDAYDNRQFIDDYDYTHRNSPLQEEYGRYSDYVIGFRYATRHDYGFLNDYWDDVKERFAAYNATSHGIDEYIARTMYPGWWNEATQTYRGKYDDSMDLTIDDTISTGNTYMQGPNNDCPAPILPLTDDRLKIKAHVDALVPNGNTNSANGAIWGWRVISPGAPFTEAVEYDNGQWQKAVVIMTDGVNVASSSNTHWESRNTAYGYSLEERMGQGVDRPGRGGSGFDDDRMADHFDEKLLRVCRRMKEQDILVYTIVFGLNDSALEEVFRTCATGPQSPFYHKAPSGEDLEEAFGDIAADLVKLHVSR